jgi:hypothetical protein
MGTKVLHKDTGDTMDENGEIGSGEQCGIYYAFVPAPVDMLRSNRLSLAEKGFLLVLMLYARESKGEFIVQTDIKTIAAYCNRSESVISKLIASLIRRGFITRRRRLGAPSVTGLAFLRPDNW